MTCKITTEAINAFMSGINFSKSNTGVKVSYASDLSSFVSELYLHNNLIAKYDSERKIFKITNDGWFSNTTKERLNGIPGVSIVQNKGVWYLNGNEWDGDWIKI